jgi:hypothetical protein
MAKRSRKRKFSSDPRDEPLWIRKQIARYGKPWSDLSPREQWYQRHKTRSRGKPVNAYIPFPKEPSCYGDWEDDACGVCGQQYEDFRPGIDYSSGIELMLQHAKMENVQGGGYRSRGAVLYAMAVLKRREFFTRHELNCCRVVFEMENYQIGKDNFNFFPFPRIVWYLTEFGQQDKKAAKNIEEAKILRAAIEEALRADASKLSELEEFQNIAPNLKKRIRALEKKYRYRNWWSQMKRETKNTGIFFKNPGDWFDEWIAEDEFGLSEPIQYDSSSDELPF